MPVVALRSGHHRWRDIDGIPISLFCWVEQIIEDPEPGVLPSRLHQRGRFPAGASIRSVCASLIMPRSTCHPSCCASSPTRQAR